MPPDQWHSSLATTSNPLYPASQDLLFVTPSFMKEGSLESLYSTATTSASLLLTSPATVLPPAGSLVHMRLALTVTHLFLVSLGTVNLLVILVILMRPYMRSITNVYMISLCLADFIYLANLTIVAATQLNEKSWPFGSYMCTVYHGTETTGKYASVMFVVSLAADRYCAMCKVNWCARYRNYRTATVVSLVAWTIAVVAASPLYVFSEVALLRYRNSEQMYRVCIAKWPSSDTARWYITFSSILIFALPLVLIVIFYYHIINKLREAVKSCKRMRRGASSRAPYQRVTKVVLWVVVFHVICWSPFWLFNLFSSIFRLRISTQFDRIVVNIIHLFPYVNCALNPMLYAVNAENFRTAFRSLFCHHGFSIGGSNRQQSTILGGDGLMNEDSRFVSGFATGISNGARLRSSTYVRRNSGLDNSTNTSSERLMSATIDNYGVPYLATNACSASSNKPLSTKICIQNGDKIEMTSLNSTIHCGEEGFSKLLGNGTTNRFNRIFCENSNTTDGTNVLTTIPTTETIDSLVVENSFIVNRGDEGDVLM